MRCRGIRGATVVASNTREDILAATRELLGQLVAANKVVPEDVACAVFTTTTDLTAEFPAVAAREMGWWEVALMCGHEMAVPDGLPRCLRIMLLVNTEKPPQELVHVYLRGAEVLRSRGVAAP
ncbi:MAG: chorismate mutase [Chloroflexi bacterium]|nr:chorismate mutase [Chloroflexota bacterium]